MVAQRAPHSCERLAQVAARDCIGPVRPEQVRLPTDRIEDPRAIDVLIDGEGYRPKALKPVPGTAAPADAPAQEKEKGYEF